MSISSDQKPTQQSRKGDATSEQQKEKEESQIQDILDFLVKNDHVAKAYPDKGIVVGVRFDSIPNSRSVHVDLATVLDLNSCELPRISMQKEVLNTADRELKEIFQDLEIDERLESKSIVTPFGKIEFDMLQSSSSPEKCSLIRESRTNYVVTSEMVDKDSYSWLCEPKRILNMQDFDLFRRSDALGNAPPIRAAITPEKWDSLESGITKAWFAFMAVLFAIVGGATTFYSYIIGGIGWYISLLLACFATILTVRYGFAAREDINSFRNKLIEEETKLAEIGDTARIREQLCQKDATFKKIEDIHFVISTLVSSVVDAIENARIKEAAKASLGIIEKCAKNSSKKRASVPDDGLAAFLGLFEELDADLSENDFDELAISYAGLAAYSSEEDGALIGYIGTLYRALARAGVINNALLQKIYDSVNGLGVAAMLRQEIASETPDEIPEPDIDNDGLFDRMASADISEADNEEEGISESSEDELEITGREVADSRLKGSPLESSYSEEEEAS